MNEKHVDKNGKYA